MNFDIDISIGVYFFIQFVLFDDVIGNVRYFESHVIGSFHWSVQKEVAYVNGHDFSPLVEMLLLSRSFTVSMSYVGVPQSPGKLIRLLTTVSRMRYGYIFSGR